MVGGEEQAVEAVGVARGAGEEECECGRGWAGGGGAGRERRAVGRVRRRGRRRGGRGEEVEQEEEQEGDEEEAGERAGVLGEDGGGARGRRGGMHGDGGGAERKDRGAVERGKLCEFGGGRGLPRVWCTRSDRVGSISCVLLLEFMNPLLYLFSGVTIIYSLNIHVQSWHQR